MVSNPSMARTAMRLGTELLRIVAARLSRVMRAEDMVSRLGSDEFGCLVSALDDRAQLGQLAGKVYDAVSAPCFLTILARCMPK